MSHFVSAFCLIHSNPQHPSIPVYTSLSPHSNLIQPFPHFVLPPLYSLQKVTSGTNVGKMCFLSKSAGEGSYLGGFKAWIKTNPTTARQFTLVYDGEGDPTGIVEALGLQNDNVEIYDLSGRKLSSYKNGINIVNGKKVMVQ